MHNVIVTGGSRGLGLSISKTLAADGFNVIIVARRETKDMRQAIEQTDRLHFKPFDLTDVVAIPGYVKALRAEFGTLYGLVNNAALGNAGLIMNMQDSSISELLQLNLTSPMILTKYVVRSMTMGKSGRIVNLSSVVAVKGYQGISVYSATKAALNGFTRSLARELGPRGITVNSVAPGFVDTAMTHELSPEQREKIKRRSPLHRIVTAEDVAETVGFLFSDKAQNITGTVMTVDAGNTA